MEPGIDVVVVNYRTTELLHNFIESYNNSDFADSDLFVVDNDPLPEQVDINKSISRDAFYLFSKENIGYARACNWASGFSQRKYIAFMNSDCVLLPDTLSKMYAGMEEHGFDIAGPLQYNRNNKVTAAGIFGKETKPQDRGFRNPNLDKFRDIKEAISISGSAYFIRADVWDTLSDCELFQEVAPGCVGAFLPTQHYYEETWVSYHARAHGYKVWFYGEAEMIHEWHKSSKVGSVEKEILPASKEYFQRACAHHGITCE